MPFEIIRADITKVNTDAIVNAANTHLIMGGGVCGAIFSAAGAQPLQEECDKIGGCAVGQAVITKGYDLAARYIIHAVGPIWQGGSHGERMLLYNAYKSSLELAKKYKLNSIAFPLISSGIYGYPQDEALKVAKEAISDFLADNDMRVILVVYDRSSFKVSESLFASVKEYISDNYVEKHNSFTKHRALMNFEILKDAEDFHLQKEEMDATPDFCTLSDTPMYSPPPHRTLDKIIHQLEDTFSERLLRLIDEKGKSDVEVYKKANMDRKLFSKIRSNRDYKPKKSTVLSLSIALELNIDETLDLLATAGFTLSNSSKFDLIIRYFIEEGNYDIYEINETLFAFQEGLLGA